MGVELELGAVEMWMGLGWVASVKSGHRGCLFYITLLLYARL